MRERAGTDLAQLVSLAKVFDGDNSGGHSCLQLIRQL
jgi:hypothetical protein